jgi:hypothetical protein
VTVAGPRFEPKTALATLRHDSAEAMQRRQRLQVVAQSRKPATRRGDFRLEDVARHESVNVCRFHSILERDINQEGFCFANDRRA